MGQGRRSGLKRTAAAGALVSSVAVLSFVWAPAFGQETGGPLFTAGVSSTVRASDNLGLNPSSPGGTILSETRLSFGFQSVTRTQEFSIRFADTFEFGFGEEAPDSAGFQNTEFDLNYAWRGKNAALDVDARFEVSDLDDDPFLLDPDDPGSLLVLGSGTVTRSNVGLRFETGLTDPFGVEVRLSQGRLDYSDTGNPDLIDTVTTSGTLSAIFRPNQVTETRLSYSQTIEDIDDLLGTESTSRSLTFSASASLDEVTQVSGSIGWAEVVQDFTAVPLLPETRSEGMTASLAYSRELPAGEISLSLDYTLNRLGDRTDVLLTRDFELPTGGFGFELGATAVAGHGTHLVGGLAYAREWPDQTFRVSLSSTIGIRSDTTVERTTRASVEYGRQINELEALDFGISYGAVSQVNGGGDDRARITASAAYTRELTRDWVMQTGYVHRFRAIEGQDNANSNELFVRLERDFSWRP